MADIDGFGLSGPVEDTSSSTKNRTIDGADIGQAAPGITITTYYLMVAIDDNADGSPGQERPFYRTWVVTDAPDLTAALYTGSFFGMTKNFINIYIQATWAE